MFDIGFSELLIIGIVALVVLGPERLPKVARMAGHLMGRVQRYAASVKADLQREMEMSELGKAQSAFHDAARQIEQTLHQSAHAAESAVGVVGQQLQSSFSTTTIDTVDDPPPSAQTNENLSVPSFAKPPVILPTTSGALDFGIEAVHRSTKR